MWAAIFPFVTLILGSLSLYGGTITNYQYWILILLILITLSLIEIKEHIKAHKGIK